MIPAPSCLGKLPLHGDFLRIRVQQAQKAKLDQWFASRTKPLNKANTAASGTEQPVSPWCFVIHGSLLGTSRHLMAIGVLFDSMDKIGRSYPFIMYQFVPKRWLMHQLKEPENWLKTLRDLALQCARKDSKQLDEMLKKLWEAYKPEWRDFFWLQNSRQRSSSQQQAQQLFKLWQGQVTTTKTSELNGVTNPPWQDWPRAVVAENNGSFWWRLDDKGHYLNCIQHPRLDQELLDKLMA